MATEITCSKCSQRLRVPNKKIGEIGRCPKCKSSFKIDYAPDGTLAVMTLLSESKNTSKQKSQPKENKASKLSSELLTTPFLVEEGAVVDSPGCNKRQRILDDDFNEELECSYCKCLYVVILKNRHRIDFACPNCLLPMDIGAHMGGKTTRCIRNECGFGPISIPNSPLKVKRVEFEVPAKTTADSNSLAPITSGLIIAGTLLAGMNKGHRSGGRLCYRCLQRHVRNPSGLCFKCKN